MRGPSSNRGSAPGCGSQTGPAQAGPAQARSARAASAQAGSASANALDDLLGDAGRHLFVVVELHAVGGAALRPGA